jgi:hypothetical protein
MRRFWAVARETFIECLRTRVVVIFVLLLGVCVVAMALTMEGDGTLKGRIQTFLAYSAGVTQLLLALVTVFLATGVVAADIRQKTIFTVASKPLARWQYVLGRWSGIVLLNALLLAMATGAIYGLARYLRGTPTRIEARKAAGQLSQDEPDLDRLAVDSEVFTARAVHHPEAFDVEGVVEQRFQRLLEEKGKERLIRGRVQRELENQRLSTGDHTPIEEQLIAERLRDAKLRERILAGIKDDLRQQAIEQRQLVMPGTAMRLTFKGLKLRSGKREPLQIRYRLRPLRVPESRILKSYWEIYNPKTGLRRGLFRDDATETASSFIFPPEAVTSEGELTIFYANRPDPRTITPVKIKPEEVTVFYRVGSFEGNLLRAALVILFRLMFLAAAGVLLGVFLSFPIACLVCLIFLGLGMMSGFIQEATKIGTWTGANPTTLDHLSHSLVQFVFFFLPTFSQSRPADALVEGTVISAGDVIREFLVSFQRSGPESNRLWRALGLEVQAGAGLRAWLCLGLGWLIFRRRELAKVQV